jgi:glutathione S-transferase
MLIVNDEQRLRAGIASLGKRCQYCSKALAAYPLILSDDAKLAVYHAACAVQLADSDHGGSLHLLQPACPIRSTVYAHGPRRPGALPVPRGF